MRDFLMNSAFLGLIVTLGAYWLGCFLKKKLPFAIVNPLLISILCTAAYLIFCKVDYSSYASSTSALSYLLTPTTICLAVPLYEKFELLKKNWKAILLGIGSGVITSLTTVLLLSLLFGLDHAFYVTFLPKSVTTAIGMGISEELGGYVPLTVTVIIVTGVLGNILASGVCRLFRITDPIAKGIGIGSASHAIGTARAMEMGEVEGAMSGLSIAVSGVLTVFAAALYSLFL